MDAEVLAARVRTMERARSLAGERLMALFIGGFAALARVLAAVGLYGVIVHSVSQRTHELGVRIALRAGRTDVVRQGMLLTVIGIAIGLAGAAATRVLSTLLYGVTPRDAAVFVTVPLVLAAVSLAASYVPARRAARVDPIEALRCE